VDKMSLSPKVEAVGEPAWTLHASTSASYLKGITTSGGLWCWTLSHWDHLERKSNMPRQCCRSVILACIRASPIAIMGYEREQRRGGQEAVLVCLLPLSWFMHHWPLVVCFCRVNTSEQQN
jgi:hypothetical protein